jgi:hypothetical protein
MSIEATVKNLRSRLTEYREYKRVSNSEVSLHINSIEIALCLVELALKDDRKIDVQEEKWFNASYYLDYVLANSPWEDLMRLYNALADYIKRENFFRG